MSRDISSNEESKSRNHDRVNLVFEKQPLKTVNWCSLDVLPAHIMELTTFFFYSLFEWNMFGRYVKSLYALQSYLLHTSPLDIASC